MIKHGKDPRQKQRYFCKKCKTTKVEFYTYKAYKQEINQNIIALTALRHVPQGMSKLDKIGFPILFL
jgi:transposase-like protein